MGYESWSEEVEVQIGVDKNGNPVNVKQNVEYYKIVCDYCGEEIVNSKTGNGLGSGYMVVKGSDGSEKYYHLNCYEIVKVQGE